MHQQCSGLFQALNFCVGSLYLSGRAGTAKYSRTPLQVMAAQANFVRVKVESVEGAPSAPPPRDRLLCVVRGLLKKIKQSVLVGDTVKVVGIDWTDGRGGSCGLCGQQLCSLN